MMTVQITCPSCKSGIHIYPDKDSKKAECDVCNHVVDVNFSDDHINNHLKECAVCSRKDFYQQKDFNKKIGASLYIVTIIISTVILVWFNPIYSIIPFIALYVVDFFLFQKIKYVAVCYKCETVYRDPANIDEIYEFNHEMHDRILYSDHDFDGKPLSH